MFFHLFKYRIKSLLKQKIIVFWSFIFPVIMGTMFFFTFGNSSEIFESFSSINIAIVNDGSVEGSAFIETAENVEFSEGKPMFLVNETTLDEGMAKVKDGGVTALIDITGDYRIITKESGISQSIVKQFTDRYRRTMDLCTDIAMSNPHALQRVIDIMQAETDYIIEVTVGGETSDENLQFFYALIAMTCMYGSFVGLNNITDIQANATPLGARRVVAPTHHMKMITADMTAAVTVNFCEIMLTWLYLRLILGMNIGTQPALFIPVCFIGSVIGVGLGTFIGAVCKGNENRKVAISISVSMLTSFLSGLMSSEIKYIVDKNVPVINRINPAALITDCFYCLTVYSDYERYLRNVITLGVIAILMTVGSFLTVRRTKYVSV